MFLVDGTGSMTGLGFDSIIYFIKHFTQMFKIGPNQTQFALIFYFGTVRTDFYLNTYSTSDGLQNAIEATR